uniref:Uncharacterized protein n=1 Tax=Rhizophora mucronata TaxID=61149 RepID=A0A2P2Q963_RHIMU
MYDMPFLVSSLYKFLCLSALEVNHGI